MKQIIDEGCCDYENPYGQAMIQAIVSTDRYPVVYFKYFKMTVLYVTVSDSRRCHVHLFNNIFSFLCKHQRVNIDFLVAKPSPSIHYCSSYYRCLAKTSRMILFLNLHVYTRFPVSKVLNTLIYSTASFLFSAKPRGYRQMLWLPRHLTPNSIRAHIIAAWRKLRWYSCY